MTEPPTAELKLPPRGHAHNEAFCLMWYQCQSCGAKDRIWNSRDGVTPFGMDCPSCGGHRYYHVYFGSDKYAPQFKLRNWQRFWRDGTPEEAAAIMRRRIERCKGTEYECSDEKAQELIEHARAQHEQQGGGEFQKGWPMLDIHRESL